MIENPHESRPSSGDTGSTGSTDSGKSLRGPVAVVAIHGVADQQPGRSVRSVGDLLLRLREEEDGGEVYTGFREVGLRIPLRPVEVPSEGREPAESERSVNERPAYVLRAMSPRGSAPPAPGGRAAAAQAPPSATPAVPIHHRFNRWLLEKYRASRGAYETVRLEGRRADGREVHLYEMYWADLSRVGQGLLAILGALYQLVFHLPELGRLTVDHALVEDPGDPAWSRLARVHAWAVRLLNLAFPLILLAMALTLLGLLPGALPRTEWIAGGLLVVVGLVLGGMLRYHRRPQGRHSTWWWSLFPFLTALGAVGVGALLLRSKAEGRSALTADQLLTLIGIAIASAVYFWVIGSYDRHRPGSHRWGRVIWLVLFLLPMLWATFAGDAPALGDERSRIAIAGNLLNVFEAQLNVALVLAGVFVILALGSGLLGLRVVRRAAPGPPRRRARRVVWTALSSLTLATTLAYGTTLVIGAGGLVAARPLLPHVMAQDDTGAEKPVSPPHQPRFDWNERFVKNDLEREGQTLDDLTQERALELLFRYGATTGVLAVLVGLALVVFIAAWGLAPAVWGEIRPPAGDRASRLRSSESLGRWLDRTYGAMAGAMVCLYLFTFLISPALTTARILDTSLGWDLPWLDFLWQQNGVILAGAGAVVAASAVGLAFHGRLLRFALGFRPVLDVALDVDGYLRDFPRESTPRARMFERYASLLRHLGGWRNEEGEGYSAIVLVAHSQGSVLTADLLDFLRREKDPELAWLDAEAGGPRLYLFTMGSPLAQLYARNFPSLYGWVTSEPTFEEWPDLPSDLPPDPTALGLTRWVNVYRSGDYVGRLLWRDRAASADRLWAVFDGESRSPLVSEDPSRLRRERCLGAGAHTHYWDRTADIVAQELDLLITASS